MRSPWSFTWTWNSGGQSSIGYRVTRNDYGVRIILHYRWRDSESIAIPVHVQTTPTQFGGERSWFTCPLIVRDRACNRRVGKLHLPPGARYFGCRTCHDLSYRSAQEAHSTERVFAWLGLSAEQARNFDRIDRGKG
jgi:hypothetical protein